MKKILTFFMAVFFVLGFAGPGTAGVIFDTGGSCNDYYMAYVQGEGAYLLYGYEYGCGETGRLGSGGLQIAGGVAYFGLTGTTANSPGQLVMYNYAINLGTNAGIFEYLYVSSGGMLSGTGAVTMTFGPPQATVEAVGQDASAQ